MPEGIHDALRDANDNLANTIALEAGADQAGWLSAVRESVRALYETLENHRHTAEEDGGTLHNATALKPGLMPAAERLEHEHADMLHRAAEIDAEIERQIAADDFNIELARLQSRVLHGIVLLHMLRTDALIYDAYFRTEGGEGG